MQKALISLFGRVSVPSSATGSSRAMAHALNAEAAVQGYTFTADLIEALSVLDEAQFAGIRKELLTVLSDLSGSWANHAALYNGFPYLTPSGWDYITRRIVEEFRNFGDRPHNNHVVLSCGHFICDDLFPDLDQFSACPLCQRQVRELGSSDGAKHPFSSVTPLKPIDLADGAFLRDAVAGLVLRKGSLSAQEREFVNEAILGGVRLEHVPSEIYQENLPLLFAATDENADAVRPLVKGASDVLRIATWMSNPEADLSLSTPTKFKITRARRRKLLDILESLSNLEEDLLRHREKWKRLGFALHAGSEEVRAGHPRVHAAFAKLRNAPHAIDSFNRRVEFLLRGRHANELAELLATRPGDFMRRLDVLYRMDNETPKARESGVGSGSPFNVLAKLIPQVPDNERARMPSRERIDAILEKVVPLVDDAMLLTMRKYMLSRRLQGKTRTFVPKGVSNRMKVVEDRRAPIPADTAARASGLMQLELVRRFSQLPALGKVFVDPTLDDQVLPFNRRGDSATTSPVVKGQRFPVGTPPVIRAFVHWTGEDVDLSLVLYDAAMNVMARIYYGDLDNDWNVVHSGDVQYAPEGASEFVDFEPAYLLAGGVRYAMVSVISYAGGNFARFPCFAGFMERDAVTSGAKFEPQSVALKFDMNAQSTMNTPLIFDLATGEAIFADISSGSGSYGNVADRGQALKDTVQAVLNLPKFKPTLGDVARLHAQARGVIVDRPEDADLVIDWNLLSRIDPLSSDDMASIGQAGSGQLG